MIADFNRLYRQKDILNRWQEPVPQDIMEKLLKIPYFKAGYEPDGIKEDDFVNQPSFTYTANEFSGSMKFIENYVVERKKNLK